MIYRIKSMAFIRLCCRRVLGVGLCAGLLVGLPVSTVGCGQKGPLTLPQPAEKPQSSAPENE